MNITTAKKIKYVAELAHEDVALTTLKNAKDGIRNRTKIFAGYEHNFAGVDMVELMAAFEQPMDCTRKADFSRRCELLMETMDNIINEAERNEAAAASKTREAARIANRDHGIWITADQARAKLAENADYTADQIARLIVNDVNAAARRQTLADEMRAAQAAHEVAQVETVRTLEATTQTELATGDATDSAEFAEYERAEEELATVTTRLLQACGRYSIELAELGGKSAADVDALKQMFMPYFTVNTEHVHPGTRNALVSKALEMPTPHGTNLQQGGQIAAFTTGPRRQELFRWHDQQR